MLTIPRDLNVYSSGMPPIISLSQYDSDFQLVFNLYTSEGTLNIPSGTTAQIQGTKRDGNGYSASATISGNTVTVTGHNQMTACAGANIYEISLTNSGKVLNTINFILAVEPAAMDAGTIQSETVLKELQAIIDSAATSTQAAQDAEDAADRAEEAARSLTVDPTLTQSGQPADAKVTGDEINDLKADISNISHCDSVTVNSGSFVKLSGYFRSTGTISADENTKILYFECLPNAVYTINKILSARFRIGYTTVVPAVGVTVYGFKEDNNATSLKLTTGDNAHYVVVYYYDGNNDTLTEAEIFNSIRITGKVNMTAIDRVARGEISQIEPGLSDDAKIALLNCFAHVAWTDGQGQVYYNALEAALYESVYPRITAVFNSGSNTIYTDDPLSTLKQYITVTYYETEQSEGTVIPSESYTLSGVLTEGVNTIGVIYNNVSTTVTIPNVVDFYNIWTWNLGDGRLQKVVGSVDINQSDTTKYPSKAYIRTDVTARRNFNTNRGILPYYAYNQTAVSSGYYPIPVPKDANHMKITLTPSTQYIFAQVFAYNSSNNTYDNSYSQNRIKWANGLGGGEIDIDRPNNEQSMFLCINTKYDDAGTSYPTEPTGLTIEFSEVTP